MIIDSLNENIIIKLLLIIALITNNIKKDNSLYKDINIYKKFGTNSTDLKIFIMAHKDFDNSRHNPVYYIVVDDKTQLKNKYYLNVIYANK